MPAKTYKQDDKNDIAYRLKNLRRATGSTQQRLGDHLEISRSTYTYYEMAKTVPDVFSLYRIAQFYAISIDAFFADRTHFQSVLARIKASIKTNA